MRLVIIGGGPGGYTAAFAAAERGCDVSLVEQDALGGTCLNRGCIPTKTMRASAEALALARRMGEYGVMGCAGASLDAGAVRSRMDNVCGILRGGLEKRCASLRIGLHKGHARLAGQGRVMVRNAHGEATLEADAIILATGSRILELPGLVPDHTHICDSDDALALTQIPPRLVIVGGGVIGCELACIYSDFGSQVTIVEGQDRLLPLPSVDEEISRLLARELRKRKVTQILWHTLAQVNVADGVVHAAAVPVSGEGAPAPLEAEAVFVTVGRTPNIEGLGLAEAGVATDARGWISVDATLQTSVPGIYAIGDALGPGHVMLAHVAAMEGLCVVDQLLGAARTMRYDAMPSAIFTEPEIGCVGLSEAQARQAYSHVVCGMTQMRELGKAHAMGQLPGFFKVVADGDTGRILGVHMAGAHSADMLGEATLAVSRGVTLAELACVIHAHPTLSEGLWEAARAALTRQQTSRA